MFEMEEAIKNENKQESPHKGLFYRVKESMYYSQSSGVFHKKLTLTPLKRMSCKGCSTCDYIEEMISELGTEELIEGKWKSGEIVELKVEGDRCWTDYGYEYDAWLEWKGVNNGN